MTTIRRFVQRLLSFVRHGRAEDDLAREVGAHLHLLEDEFVAKGMTRADARLAARRAFGGVEQAKEHHRDARAFRWLDDSRIDFKLGARMLVKYPGLSAIGGVGLTVATAIGAAFFAFFSSYIYATLPVEDGDRVVALENWNLDTNNEARRSMHDFVTWRREMTTVTDISAFRTLGRNLIVQGGAAEPVEVAQMTASSFRLTRIPPHLGRPLLDADEADGAAPVIVIGHDVWQSRFGSDPTIVGQQVRVGNIVHTIVGVMPREFAFPVHHQYWTPLSTNTLAYERGQGPSVFVFGRLRDGATMEQAQAELSTLGQRAATEFPEANGKLEPRVMPYAHPVLDIQGITGWWFASIQAIVSILIVIVAVNVAVLVYARTATRQGEIAVRTALGASRRRIVGQLFIEALVLSGGASILGLLLAQVGLAQGHAIMATEGGGLPYFVNVGMSNGAIAYTAGLAILAAAIAGIIPALHATGRRMQSTLKQGSGGSGLQLGRTWTVLIVAQVALAVAGLPAAIAMGWTGIQSAMTFPAFDEQPFLAAVVAPDPDAAESSARFSKFSADLVAKLRDEPSVADVTVAWASPNSGASAQIEIDGALPPQSGAPITRRNRVAVDFFDVLGARLTAGRALSATDALPSSAPAVVVNRTFVRQILGDTAAVGRRIRYVAPGEREPDALDTTTEFEIVGVMSDLYTNTTDPNRLSPIVFHPLRDDERSLTALIRVRGSDPQQFSQRIRDLTASLDPTARLRVSSFTEFERQQVLVYRLIALVLVLIIIAVLLLSAAGIYALMSFTVSQRRKEIGIRAAMGADSRQLLRSIFAKAAFQLALGVVVGVGAVALFDAMSGGELLGSIGRPLLPAMSIVMIAVGLIASIGPARRSLKVQPTEALRAE
jgi:putative ABC transport system permease protein